MYWSFKICKLALDKDSLFYLKVEKTKLGFFWMPGKYCSWVSWQACYMEQEHQNIWSFWRRLQTWSSYQPRAGCTFELCLRFYYDLILDLWLNLLNPLSSLCQLCKYNLYSVLVLVQHFPVKVTISSCMNLIFLSIFDPVWENIEVYIYSQEWRGDHFMRWRSS